VAEAPNLFAGLNPKNITPPLSPSSQRLADVRSELQTAPEFSSFSPEGEIVLGQPQPLDIYTLYTGEGLSKPYTVPEIAFHAVYGQRFENPAAAYTKLKETMTDEQIITRLARDPTTNDLYSLPTEKEAFATGLAKTTMNTGAGLLGMMGAGAVTGNPFLVMGAGAAAAVTSAMMQEAAGDGTRIFPSRRNPEMTGEFMGGAPFIMAPFAANPGAMAKAGENLLFEGIKKTPYAGPVMRFVTEGGGRVLESGFDISRRNPVLASLVESSATVGGGGAGYVFGRSMDPTAVDPSMGRLGVEVVASIVNPVSVLQLIPSGINMWRRSLFGKGKEGQEQLVADEFIKLFDELAKEGTAPDDLGKILQQTLGENSPLQKFLIQEGYDPGNPTSAQKTGHPVLAIMQANAIKNDPSGFGRRVQNSALSNLNQLELMMGGLLQLNTPEALGLYAQLRGQYFDRAMEGFVSNALLRYQNSANRATRGGEPIDEQAELNKILTSVIDSARQQEKAFYDRIPNSYSTKAENLIEAFDKLQLDNAILSQPGRLDTGSNYQSIAVAIDDMKKVLDNNSTDPEDLSEFAESSVEEIKDEVRDAGLGGLLEGRFIQSADGPAEETATATGARRLPLPEEIYSRDLKNLRAQVLEAIANEKPGPMGETRLAESLGILEEAIRKDLSELPADEKGVARRNLENAMAFSESFNNTFSQLFTTVKRTGPPEMFMNRVLRGNPSVANLALRDIDNAVSFLETELIKGDIGTENLRNVYVDSQQNNVPGFENEFFIPQEGAKRGEYELFEDLNKLPYRQNTLRQLEERTLRAIFRKYTRPDGTPDQAGIDRWLADEQNINLIERISPPTEVTDEVTGQKIRQSPLLEDLRDMQTRGALFNSTRDAASRRTQLAHEQIPLFAFLTGGIPMRNNPPNAIGRLLGEPNNRPDNPIIDFRAVAKNISRVTDDDIDALDLAKKYTPSDLRKSLFDATVGQAFVYGRGDVPGEPFSFIKFNDFMNKPIIPGQIDELDSMVSNAGRRSPSPLEILKEEGIVDEKAFRNFQIVVDEAMNIENALLQIKTLEGDDKFQVLADLYARNPVSTELVTRILGARLGVEMAGLLPGGMGQSSLIAASAGSRALQSLFNKVPRSQFKDVYMEALTNPEYMSKLIGLGLERKSRGQRGPTVFEYMNDLPLATKAVTAARSLLVGAGVREDSLPTVSEIMAEVQEDGGAEGTTTGLINPSRPLTPGEEAGLKRRALRQPSPQAMTDQAQQFLPQMPPPQAPPPVAQAPANPDTRAQFAAMYPNDITSSLIRTQQGIGSLLS